VNGNDIWCSRPHERTASGDRPQGRGSPLGQERIAVKFRVNRGAELEEGAWGRNLLKVALPQVRPKSHPALNPTETGFSCRAPREAKDRPARGSPEKREESTALIAAQIIMGKS